MKQLKFISLLMIATPSFSLPLSEVEFNTAIDKVVQSYRPIIAGHNAVLTVKRNWQSSEQNATALRKTNTSWELVANGGLVRHALMTQDVFTLILCHELGHLMGGFPTFMFNNSASEGQADYYATQVCLRKVWNQDFIENAKFRSKIHPTGKMKCDQVWSTTEDQDLCYRILNAGFDAGRHNQTFHPQDEPIPVSFDAKSDRVVSSTAMFHSLSQCRFDTYSAGALCVTDFDHSMIPKNQQEALENSCDQSDRLGQRPRCWFKEE